jgi:hypothetical protein
MCIFIALISNGRKVTSEDVTVVWFISCVVGFICCLTTGLYLFW